MRVSSSLPKRSRNQTQMLALAAETPSALLCFERDPAECHRTMLLDAVAPDVEVTHLFA